MHRIGIILLAGPLGLGAGPLPAVPQEASSSSPAEQTAQSGSVQTAASEDWFIDVAEAVGLDFVHFNGMTGEFYFPEVTGAGCALFDYDNDGDLDVFLVQGILLGEGKSLSNAVFPPPASQPLTSRLYRNDLSVSEDGKRTLRFTDVTQQMGHQVAGYGMGVAVGDVDNDGWLDLYITQFGPNQLLRNRGNGTFEEITAKAGVEEPRWSASAAFLDFDRDGWLDLFVGNYVDFTYPKHKPCYAPDGMQDYCSPLSYQPLPNRLFRNRGNGTFEDVSTRSGIQGVSGGALGVVSADFNGDGWIDIYVANDSRPNQLWLNQKDGTFREDSLLAGVAVNMDGAPQASMGVDAGDFDGDGDEDLFMTHLREEYNTLYVNDGQGWFQDRSVATGLATLSQGYTAFGTAWIDYDNDGRLDLFVANGDVRTIAALAQAKDPYPLHQPNHLLANQGDGQFRNVSAQGGKAFLLSEVSRGTALGDVDNDGDSDLLVSNNSGRVRLLLNQIGTRNHWLGLRLLDRSRRDALGARIAVYPKQGPPLWRRVRTDGSFASANDPRVLVGLGQETNVQAIRVFWPGGRSEEWGDPGIDRYATLQEGSGKEITP